MIRADPRHHTVTVRTAIDDSRTRVWLDDVTLTCTAPEGADCRTYPTCDCENVTEESTEAGYYMLGHRFDISGHRFETGQDCWVKGWFDDSPEASATTYVGPDTDAWHESRVPLADRSGHVEITGFDLFYGPEWRWADE